MFPTAIGSLQDQDIGGTRWAPIFPMMSPPEFDDLAADIKANGLVSPIVLDAEGLILDGRNRFAACRKAGVEPHFKRCAPDADSLAVVVSLNVKRRNLKAAQRASAAADAWLRAEAEGKVQKQGGPRQKAQSGLITDPRSHFAKLFGVNKDYVEVARDLLLDDPVGAAAVREGTADLRA